MALEEARVVRLDDYRRNAWTAVDLTWEHVAQQAVAAMAMGERLRAALLLPQADGIARLHLLRDDPRRAATLTMLARWQLMAGNGTGGESIRLQAEQTWWSAARWIERLRPGESDEGQAECRRLLQRAMLFTARLGQAGDRRRAELALPPERLAGLSPDRRKLETAVAIATADIEPVGQEKGARARDYSGAQALAARLVEDVDGVESGG
jgi:hypothetical protein